MFLSKDTIRHVAHLARIELNKEELDRLSGQLQQIVNFIDKLKKIDIKDIAPTSHILPISDVARQDKNRASLPREEALRGAPQSKEGFFCVPKVIE